MVGKLLVEKGDEMGELGLDVFLGGGLLFLCVEAVLVFVADGLGGPFDELL